MAGMHSPWSDPGLRKDDAPGWQDPLNCTHSARSQARPTPTWVVITGERRLRCSSVRAGHAARMRQDADIQGELPQRAGVGSYT
jgi:hypothetical protein